MFKCFWTIFSLGAPETLEHEIKPLFSAAVHSVCKELGQAKRQAIRVFSEINLKSWPWF